MVEDVALAVGAVDAQVVVEACIGVAGRDQTVVVAAHDAVAHGGT